MEARRRGVRVLPLDVNASKHRYTVENGAIRVGLMQVKGISASDIQSIEDAQASGPFTSAADFAARTDVPVDVFENLALAGAFDSIEPNRRAVVWAVRRLASSSAAARKLSSEAEAAGQMRLSGLEDGASLKAHVAEASRSIRDFTPIQSFAAETEILGFCVHKHAMEFYRSSLARWGALTASEIAQAKPGQLVRAAGLVVRPHRPPTKSGRSVIFLSLEDETGSEDGVRKRYQKAGAAIFGSAALLVEGTACEGRSEANRGRGSALSGPTRAMLPRQPSASPTGACR